MTHHRAPWLIGLTLVAVTVASYLWFVPKGGEPLREPFSREAQPRAVPVSLPASDVLRDWDAARASAFARGDATALRALYSGASRAGTSDLAMLRAYRARELRVRGMRMQILSLEVLDRTPRRLRLEVTDRLVGAVAVGDGQRLVLPRDRPTTRVIELRRSGGSWRVASVRDASLRPAAR